MEPTEPTASSESQQPQQPRPAQEGLDPNLGGLLSYLLFGWIGGLIMLLTQKHREVRFHGMQSILYSAALFVVYVGLTILSTVFGVIPGLGFLSGLLTLAVLPLVWLGSLALWVFLCIKGYQLAHFKLPIIGDLSEQWSGYHS